METFLLTIVLSLLLVIVLLAFVLRLVFQVGRPYSTTVLPAATTGNVSRGHGSVLGTFTLIIVAGLAFLFLRQEALPKSEATEPPPKSQNTVPPLQGDTTTLPQHNQATQRDIQHAPQPLRIHRQEQMFETSEIEIKRYNQAPKPQLSSFYAIQAGAFADELYAKRSYNELRHVLPNLQILYLIGEEAPFKLVVGEFIDADAAKDFQRKYQIKGFVRLFEY